MKTNPDRERPPAGTPTREETVYERRKRYYEALGKGHNYEAMLAGRKGKRRDPQASRWHHQRSAADRKLHRLITNTPNAREREKAS